MADPIEEKHRQRMNDLARFLDDYFNGEAPPVPMVRQRTTGFFLAVFDFNTNGEQGRFNYISNSDRLDVKVLLREMTARFGTGRPGVTWRLTGKASVPVLGVNFRQAFGTPGGMRLEPGAVNYAVYFWVSQPLSDIVITKNHGRSTYTATAGGRVVGRRYYTVTNAAAAGVRALRKSLTTGDSQ